MIFGFARRNCRCKADLGAPQRVPEEQSFDGPGAGCHSELLSRGAQHVPEVQVLVLNEVPYGC